MAESPETTGEETSGVPVAEPIRVSEVFHTGGVAHGLREELADLDDEVVLTGDVLAALDFRRLAASLEEALPEDLYAELRRKLPPVADDAQVTVRLARMGMRALFDWCQAFVQASQSGLPHTIQMVRQSSDQTATAGGGKLAADVAAQLAEKQIDVDSVVAALDEEGGMTAEIRQELAELGVDPDVVEGAYEPAARGDGPRNPGECGYL